MKNNKLFLTFKDNKEEEAFQLFYWEEIYLFAKACIVLVMVLYAVFAVLDYWALPNTYELAWGIRFGIALPLLVVNYWALTYKIDWYFKNLKLINLLEIAVLGGGIITMICLAQPHELGYHTYYTGLLIVLLLIYSNKYSFKEGFIYSTLLYFSYSLILFNQFIDGHKNLAILINDSFFFVH